MGFPPRELGNFKTTKNNNGDALATPAKGGRLASSLSHLFDEHAKTWSRINESKSNSAAKANIIKKLQSAPVSPRVTDEVAKARGSDTHHAKNSLH